MTCSGGTQGDEITFEFSATNGGDFYWPEHPPGDPIPHSNAFQILSVPGCIEFAFVSASPSPASVLVDMDAEGGKYVAVLWKEQYAPGETKIFTVVLKITSCTCASDDPTFSWEALSLGGATDFDGSNAFQIPGIRACDEVPPP